MRLFPKKYPILKSGIINLKSGTAFRGVVFDIRGGYVILRNAEILQDRNTKINKPIDGEIVISESEIDFYQVL